MDQVQEVSLTPDQVQKAIAAAKRVMVMKKYGLLVVNVVGQMALGAAGCALMLKAKERNSKAANTNVA